MQASQLRSKAQFVLFTFEEALGEYTRNHVSSVDELNTSTVQQIIDESKTSVPDNPTPADIVEASYLPSLLSLAESAAPNTQAQNAIATLHKWCDATGVFGIRNSLAHPNRVFAPHYWHIVQALATHACILNLELHPVVDSLAAAEEGSFTPPPDAWIRHVADSAIPNNLDKHIRLQGHGPFTARGKETARLRKLVLNKRVANVAIIGRGGLGKTALAIHCLKGLTTSAEAARHFHRITFVSAKSDLLTARGAKAIAPDFSTAKELHEAIARELLSEESASFSDAQDIYKDRAVLLCIDNLESALLQDPRIIDRLLEDLPPLWKVLVTSRIPVENTATVELAELTTKEAEAIAMQYASQQSLIPSQLSTAEISAIASRIDSPLAIRLAVDACAQGENITQAILEQSRITTEFAFASLIDALSASAAELLQTLAAADGECPLSFACTLLDWPRETVLEARAELIRFHLVKHVDNPDPVELIQSVLAYMQEASRVDPAITQRLTELRADLQLATKQTSTPQGLAAIQDNTLRLELRRLAIQIEDSTGDEKLLHLLGTARRLEEVHGQHAEIHKAKADICDRLGDHTTLRSELSAAIKLNPEDIGCRIDLAKSYRDARLFDEAISLCQSDAESIIRDEAPPSGTQKQHTLLLVVYLTCRIWQASDLSTRLGDKQGALQALDDVIRDTSSWATHERHSIALATHHAMALRRSAEPSCMSIEERLGRLERAYDTLIRAAAQHPSAFLLGELCQYYEQLAYIMRTAKPVNLDFAKAPLSNLATHFNQYTAGAPTSWARKWNAVAELLTTETPAGLAAEVGLDRIQRCPESLPEELQDFGYIEARIYSPANGRAFLFAKAAGEQYFIHESSVRPGEDHNSWEYGARLWILPAPHMDEGRAWPVLDALPAGAAAHD